jgi:hypothetical protein
MAGSSTRTLLRMIRKDWEIYTIQFVTLSIAIAITIVIAVFCFNELTVSHDISDKNTVRILQKNLTSAFDGKNRLSDRIPSQIFNQLKSKVATAARVRTLNEVSATSATVTLEHLTIHAADSNFLSILKFDFLSQKGTVTKNDAAISKGLAAELFDGSAMGQTLKLSTTKDTVTYTIGAVFENPSNNSHEDFNLIIGLDEASLSALAFDPTSFSVYATLASDAITGNLLEEHLAGEPSMIYLAQPIREIYMGPRLREDSARHGDSYCIGILICITMLILILAITNYINLSTLTLPSRSTEIAIRKVAGAQKGSLIRLMLVESTWIVVVSLSIGVLAIAGLMEPARKYLLIDFAEWFSNMSWMNVILIMTVIVAIALVPILPAWTFIKASPRRLLSSESISFPRLKRVITIVQLGVSISLIIASLVINRQITKSLVKEPGRNHEQVVYLTSPDGLSRGFFNRMKNDWPRDNPNITGVTSASHLPNNLNSRPVGESYYQMSVDNNFKDFMGWTMSEGRWFGAGDVDSIVVNGTANTPSIQSIGVIQNLFDSYNLPNKPVQISIDEQRPNFIMIRVLEVDIRKTLEYIGRFFFETYGKNVKVTLLDRNYAAMLENEDRLNRLSGLLSMIAGVMACCAIYALSLSRMNDSLKQIAIRKTFGASNGHIVGRLTLHFFELMLGSIVIFGPLTYFLLREWLRNFVYAARLEWSDPLVSIGACLIIVGIANLVLLRRVGVESIRELLRR